MVMSIWIPSQINKWNILYVFCHIQSISNRPCPLHKNGILIKLNEKKKTKQKYQHDFRQTCASADTKLFCGSNRPVEQKTKHIKLFDGSRKTFRIRRSLGYCLTQSVYEMDLFFVSASKRFINGSLNVTIL